MKTMKGLMVLMLILASLMTIGVASAAPQEAVAARAVGMAAYPGYYFADGVADSIYTAGQAYNWRRSYNYWGGAQCTARASAWYTQYVSCSVW